VAAPGDRRWLDASQGSELLLTDKGALEAPVVPSVTLRATDDGTLRWQFEDAHFAGVVPRLDAPSVPRDQFPPVEPGLGRIDVTVRDRFGTPMPDVIVTLSGLVSRTLQTDIVGAAAFAGLPDGRYDVVASVKGWPSSLPRVIDVTGLVTDVDIVLKPRAGLYKRMISCGPLPPRTLEGLSADADAIVHLKIVRQRMYTRPLDTDTDFIFTASTTRWIESFKTNQKIAARDEIVQLGGRIERPDGVQVAESRPDKDLNVGDEYVLFLKRYEAFGYVVLHHGPAGAFRIRNGRVEPLGTRDLANEWRGRGAETFFEALRASLNASASRRG